MPDKLIARRPVSVPTICFILACSLVLVYVAVAILVRPTMYSDSGWGFLVWDSMLRGASFNFLTSPDPMDISRDTATFMTTWSPGQYWIPGMLEKLGFSLGLAIVLVVTALSLIGLAGWHTLYTAFGFPQRTAAIAVAIIASNHFFALPFGIYNGGEPLLFGAAPWFALLIWKLRGFEWRAVPLIAVGMFMLVFAKLSGAIFAVATISAVSLSETWRERQIRRNAAVTIIAIGIFATAFYFTWLSRGWTPASTGLHIEWPRLPIYAGFVVTSTWAASLSLGDVVAYVFMHPGRAVLSSPAALYCALLPVTVVIFATLWRRLQKDYADYLRFVLIATSLYGAVLTYLYVHGSAVSIEERHFRQVSLLLLVGVVHAFVNLPKRFVRAIFASAVAASAVYGVASFAVHCAANLHHPLSIRGFRQGIATAPALHFIRAIDVAAPDGTRPLLLVTSPEIGLEARYARVLANDADFEPPEVLRRRVYRGRVSRIYVLIQTRLVANGKADVILHSFIDYPIDGWHKVSLGDFAYFYQ